MSEADFPDVTRFIDNTYSQNRARLRKAFDNAGPVVITGAPGTRRAQAVKQVAEEIGLELVQYWISPASTWEDRLALFQQIRSNPMPGVLLLDAGHTRPDAVPGWLQSALHNEAPWVLPAGWRLIVLTTAPWPDLNLGSVVPFESPMPPIAEDVPW